MEEAQARRQEARRRAQPLGERHRLAAMERDAAQKDHAAAEAQMQELRGKAHEHKRERRSEEAVQRLLQQFPGRVLGRLGELFSVPSQRDTTAVLISLGRWVDAIVTTDDAAAKECIALLKEHRLGRFQFIPLDSVQVREVDERLRHLGGTARLAVDCTSTADERVRRALLFALGKGLIADTEAEARRVAYDGPQRLTCVSLDGIKVDRRGAITGGQGGDGGRGRNARQQPFDRAAVEQVQRRELELRERLERAGVAVAAAKAAEEQAQEEVSERESARGTWHLICGCAALRGCMPCSGELTGKCPRPPRRTAPWRSRSRGSRTARAPTRRRWSATAAARRAGVGRRRDDCPAPALLKR